MPITTIANATKVTLCLKFNIRLARMNREISNISKDDFGEALGYSVVPLHSVIAPEYAMMQKGHLGNKAMKIAGIHATFLLK